MAGLAAYLGGLVGGASIIDGKAEILWQHDDGRPAVWLMDGTSVAAMGPVIGNPGPSWHVI